MIIICLDTFNMLKSSTLALLLIILFIINCQRGGSGTSDHQNRDQRWNDDEVEINTAGSSKQSDDTGYLGVGIIVTAFGVIAYLSSKKSGEAEKQRKIRIEKELSEWQQSNGVVSQENEDQIAKKMANIVNIRWRIRFQTNNGSILDDGPFKFLTTEKRSQNVYRFTFEMHDNLGRSQGSGIIITAHQNSKLIFEKTYDRRSDAGQEGSYDLLIYKGIQKGEKFKGEWAYKGHQNNSQYSGKWELINLDDL